MRKRQEPRLLVASTSTAPSQLKKTSICLQARARSLEDGLQLADAKGIHAGQEGRGTKPTLRDNLVGREGV